MTGWAVPGGVVAVMVVALTTVNPAAGKVPNVTFVVPVRFVPEIDRKSVVEGKRVDLGGRRIIKKKKKGYAGGSDVGPPGGSTAQGTGAAGPAGGGGVGGW